MTLDDEDFGDEGFKVAKTARVSISFDIQKVDEQTAAEYLSLLKIYLDDPDMMLLWMKIKIIWGIQLILQT